MLRIQRMRINSSPYMKIKFVVKIFIYYSFFSIFKIRNNNVAKIKALKVICLLNKKLLCKVAFSLFSLFDNYYVYFRKKSY